MTNPKLLEVNVFCKTGKGGGVDPTCSPKGSKSGAPTVLSDYESSPGSLRFKKNAKLSDLELHGTAFNKVRGGFWNDWKDADIGEPELPTPTGKRSVSTGVIIEEPDGRIWTIDPMNEFGGYKHTFPKGRLEKGLSGQQNAIKEVFEETGLKVEITGLVGDFEGTTSVTRFYRGRRVGGDPSTAGEETYAVRLSTPERLQEIFKRQKVTMPKNVLDTLTSNAFCATGKGGGVDPSCSPKSAKNTQGLQSQSERAYNLGRTAKQQSFGYKAAEMHELAAKAHEELAKVKKSKAHKDEAERHTKKAVEIRRIMDTGRSMDMATALKGIELTKGQTMKVELGERSGRGMVHTRRLVVRDKNGNEVYKSDRFTAPGGNIFEEKKIEQKWLTDSFNKWAGSYKALSNNSDGCGAGTKGGGGFKKGNTCAVSKSLTDTIDSSDGIEWKDHKYTKGRTTTWEVDGTFFEAYYDRDYADSILVEAVGKNCAEFTFENKSEDSMKQTDTMGPKARRVMKGALERLSSALEDVEAIQFSGEKSKTHADGGGRQSLYSFLAQRASKLFPGFVAVEIRERSNSNEYVILKAEKLGKYIDTLRARSNREYTEGENLMIYNKEQSFADALFPQEFWDEVEAEYVATAKTTTNEKSGANCGIAKGGFQKGNTCARGGVTTRQGEKLIPIKRTGKTWVGEDGSALPEHIAKLAIPPAWSNVYANPDPKGTVLAKGEDAKGRIQMRYGDSHNAKAAAAKFGRVTELRSKRSEIFKELDNDAKNPATREQAHCLKLIMQTGMRPGSEKDTGADYKSYGATTLEGRHVLKNDDGSVTLRLVTGKNKGREVDFQVTDPATAKMLLLRSKQAGKDGRLFKTNAESLRDYSKDKDGGGFKTKDHRTALGTETAIQAIKAAGTKQQFGSLKEYKTAVKEVATKVSKVLGNTPVIALSSYIDPTVFTGWSFKN